MISNNLIKDFIEKYNIKNELKNIFEINCDDIDYRDKNLKINVDDIGYEKSQLDFISSKHPFFNTKNKLVILQ